MDPIGEDSSYTLFGYTYPIEKAVEIVAVSGIVLNLLCGFYMSASSPFGPYAFDYSSIIGVCLSCLVLVALHKTNYRQLIPFLGYNALTIVLRALYSLLVLVVLCGGLVHPPTPRTTWMTIGLIFHLLMNIAKLALDVLFEHIVYRGYNYLKNQAPHESTPLLA